MSLEQSASSDGYILIVDDSKVNLEILASQLRRHGYRIKLATDAATALCLIDAMLPDLILLDIMMPDMDGYEVCQTLKAAQRTCDIPVLFLSALEEALDKVKAFSVGGADFITKPFQGQEVLARIQHQLRVRQLQQEVQQQQQQLMQQNQQLRQEIEERQKAEQALLQSKAHTQAFLDAIPDLLLRVSQDGYHLDYIPPKNFVDAFSSGNCLKQSVVETLPPALAQLQMQHIQKALATGELQVYEQQFEANGSTLYEEVRISVSGESEVLLLIRDITQRKQAENALRESEERFRVIFEQANVGISLATVDGQLIRVNQRLCDLLGYTEAELLRKTFQELTYAEDRERNLSLFHQALAGARQTFSIEKRYVCQDGCLRWVNVTVSLIVNAMGPPKYSLAIVEDIQERKKAEAFLQQTQEAALQEAARSNEANRTKSEFLATMSHELRTPLNAILGFAQLMARERRCNQTTHEYLEIISLSGEHLLNLINDVLDLSKIESGQLVLNTSVCDLSHLLQNLEAMLHVKADSKGLQLTFAYDPALPRYIQTDERKLHQVLLNLLGNAIKFTHAGRVTLRLRGEHTGFSTGNRDASVARGDQAMLPASPSPCAPLPPPHCLLFEVEDTGCGIAPDELAHLFEPFVRAKSGQSAEGTGLGLAISRKFVQLMGGDITVHSIVNQGTIVQFKLPVSLAPASAVPIRQARRRTIALAPGQQPSRLLVVEDHPESCQPLVRLLRLLGFAVQETVNGEAAIALWQTWQPHLIWMDMKMPVMDGCEATQQIRALEALQADSRPKTVIIALTASVFETDRITVLAAGCNDFVRKPFRETEILAKIAEHLGVEYVYEAEAERPDWSVQDQPEESAAWQEPLLPSLSGGAPSYTLLPSASNLDASCFRMMPTEWIQQVHQAALIGSNQELLQLIAQLPNNHMSLATTLATWVNNFQFDRVLALTQPRADLQQK